ncbi:MAG: ATP-binding cassette domain-containing protein [Chitinophagaceae bacterium]|nr:ATP-binding cassette domain-containing protein [Chitinophagaceae bacterium]
MKPAIEIRNLGKRYKLTTAPPYVALRDVISDSVKNIFSKKKKQDNSFWALQDIDFDIEPGERVGIIGRNGAGKSTLLKIISRITPPTTGNAIVRGRVGSLLEVGTGFHPELTGRENIYLNGSILGLKKAEINKQLDAIIEFSGVEKFIDTPLKHYSSGMQLRLAFSVAAHLEPEILLIDEVLAVGDIEFQKKCLGKMEEVSKKDGRTILFVSHNLKTINDFCQKALLLDKGNIVLYNEVGKVTNQYINANNTGINIRLSNNSVLKPIFISQVKTCDSEYRNKFTFNNNDKIGININIVNKEWKHGFTIGFGLNSLLKGRILRSQYYSNPMKSQSSKEFIVWLPTEDLTPGSFSIDVSILDNQIENLDFIPEALNFDISVANSKFEGIGYDYGVISKELTWENKG